MLLFDSTTLLLLFATIVSLYFRHRAPWFGVLLVLTLLVTYLHLVVEGYRWQMIPAYFALMVCTITAMTQRIDLLADKLSLLRSKLFVGLSTGVGIVLLILSALLSYALPIFELPVPDGPHEVGTTELHLIDHSRVENYTVSADDRRELMVRIWYPAVQPNADTPVPYWRHAIARSKAVTFNTPLPWFTFTHLRRVPTHSYWQAPAAQGETQYPVVLFSHGLGIGWASANTTLAESLASNGYVVVAIDHAFIGSASIFPQGRVVVFDQATSVAMSQPGSPKVQDIQNKLRSSTNWREQVALFSKATSLAPGDMLERVTNALSIQVEDQLFVLDELENIQQDQRNAFAGRLDLTRIGILGMSLGGSAALETCSIDGRCKAGVNLDGFHPKHIGLSPSQTPFLYLNRFDNLLYRSNFEKSEAAAYSVRISGATHFNFFDFTIMSPLYRRLGVLGSIDGERMQKIVGISVISFFDKHLRGELHSTGWTRLNSYPEVTFTRVDGIVNNIEL
ncbi:MAG: hypothetical protein GXP16_16735 [Gammaproteobacteria bacterium]|nr:hypothetical protein [Gammaproteobacteria bacterium]